MVLTPKQMRERFRTYKLNYIKANKFSQSTGAGVTEADIERGIHTVEDKLDDICPYYEKMDNIFGNMPNVWPLCQWDTQDSDDDEPVNEADAGGDDLGQLNKVRS